MSEPLIGDHSKSQFIQTNIQDKQELKFAGFDYLRAVFSIAIVADHAGLFTLATVLGVSALTDILYANFSYVAVPVFLQISIFLFYLKSEKVGLEYFFQKRLPKLVSLYLFWVAAKILFDLLVKGESEAVKLGSMSIRNLIEVIISGGNSPLYFFFSLLFITFLAEVLLLLLERFKESSTKTVIVYCLFFASCILIFAFSTVDLLIKNPDDVQPRFLATLSSIAEWDYNPLNFLPYLFTSFIAAQEFKEGVLQQFSRQFKLKLYSLLSLFFLITYFEWILLGSLVHYSRLSLIFGSWFLLYLALMSPYVPSRLIRFVSSCSLGIYALHLFFTHGFFSGTTHLLSPVSTVSLGLDVLIEFFLALVGSIALTLVFRRVKGLSSFV